MIELSNCTVDVAVNIYNGVLKELSEGQKVPGSKRAALRTETIFKTFEKLLEAFPDERPGLVWRIVEKAHVLAYLHDSQSIEKVIKDLNVHEEIVTELLFNDELISVFESAKQSWKRSSGIAWENFFEGTLETGRDELKVVNTSDLSKLFKGGHINRRTGEPTPLNILNEKETSIIKMIIDNKDFDLFLLYYSSPHDSWRLFGLIQCKTSIRDRIKNNAASSYDVMENHYWSILLALDPDNYMRGQYYNMAKEKWHGVYLLDRNVKIDGNIYNGPLSFLQEKIIAHANQFLQIKTVQYDLIDANWRAR